jgi:hypothetical protein
MKRSNWSWGALRISQELLLLGIHVHKKTVKRILLENGMVPQKTRVSRPTWTAFLKAHKDLWALLTGLRFYVCVRHSRSASLYTGGCGSSNKTTCCNQCDIKSGSTLDHTANLQCGDVRVQLPSGLIADNDGLFGKWMEHDFRRYFDIVVRRAPPGQPIYQKWCNGIWEWFHRSLKSEVLNSVGCLDVAGIRRLSICSQEYFNCCRPHEGINCKTPTQVTLLESRKTPSPAIRYSKTPELDGLITSFKSPVLSWQHSKVVVQGSWT